MDCLNPNKKTNVACTRFSSLRKQPMTIPLVSPSNDVNHLAGKPVVASPNVGCFLRLRDKVKDVPFHHVPKRSDGLWGREWYSGTSTPVSLVPCAKEKMN